MSDNNSPKSSKPLNSAAERAKQAANRNVKRADSRNIAAREAIEREIVDREIVREAEVEAIENRGGLKRESGEVIVESRTAANDPARNEKRPQASAATARGNNSSSVPSKPRSGSSSSSGATPGSSTGGAKRPQSSVKDQPAKLKTPVNNEPKKLVKPVSKQKVRKTTLQISRVNPFSVFKMTFMLTIALAIIGVIATMIFWFILNITGGIDSINALYQSTNNTSETASDIRDYINPGVLAFMSLIMFAVNALIISAMATLAAVIYNAAARLVGGFEVTLTDESK